MPSLSASNSRVTLSIPLPPSNSFHPGSVLHPTLKFSGSPQYDDVKLVLRGSSTANIMGLDRWQAGQMGNIGFGGNPMRITSTETLDFLELVVLQISDGAAKLRAQEHEKKSAHSGGGSIDEGMYEVTIPVPPQGVLLPSFAFPQAELAFEQSGISVKYVLEFRGARKGLFKSNDELNLEIPVTYPLPATSPPPQSHWPSVTADKTLKFTTSSSSPPNISAKLAYLAPNISSQPIRFSISLLDSSGLLLHHKETLKIVAFLSRRTRTAPIKDPGLGRLNEWPGVRVAGSKNALKLKNVSGLEWEGELEVPQNARTVLSDAVGIEYSFAIQISSKELFEGHIGLSTPIFLPSSEVEATSGSNEDRGEGPPSYAP